MDVFKNPKEGSTYEPNKLGPESSSVLRLSSILEYVNGQKKMVFQLDLAVVLALALLLHTVLILLIWTQLNLD